MVIHGEIGPIETNKKLANSRTYILDLVQWMWGLKHVVSLFCQIYRKTGGQRKRQKKTTQKSWKNIVLKNTNIKLASSFQDYSKVSDCKLINDEINKQQNVPETLTRLIPKSQISKIMKIFQNLKFQKDEYTNKQQKST